MREYFEKVNATITDSDIQDSCCVGNRGKTIDKFHRRKLLRSFGCQKRSQSKHDGGDTSSRRQ